MARAMAKAGAVSAECGWWERGEIGRNHMRFCGRPRLPTWRHPGRRTGIKSASERTRLNVRVPFFSEGHSLTIGRAHNVG
jgi:hypothetical protein